MMDDEQLGAFLRRVARPVRDQSPSRDLWPSVLARCQQPMGWTWIDLGMVAALVVGMVMRPQWLWLLAYHF